MAKKIKLNKAQRNIIKEYGVRHIQSTIDRTQEGKLYQTLVEGATKAIRIKYPEEEMVILRKYELARQDYCPRFQFPNGRVDGFSFKYGDPLAYVPSNQGSYGGEVFPVPAAIEEALDEYAKVKQGNDTLESGKAQDFRAFVTACVYLDEILEVIELPGEIRERLGRRSTGLVAVTPETVASIKATFSQAT
jgi:hypothetical protein